MGCVEMEKLVLNRSSDLPAKGGDDRSDPVKKMMELVETVGEYCSYRRTQRKESLNLVRRLKLLVPLLEEMRELDFTLKSAQAWSRLADLKNALLLAKKLLKDCNYGSKIYLALENEAVMGRFHAVYDKLNEALDQLPYNELGISDEVKEQVELMRMQLKRAKRRADTQDMELAMDMMIVFSKEDERNVDSVIIQRLANKLELYTIADMRAETEAVKKLAKVRRGQSSENTLQILDLLGKFKQVAGIDQSTGLDGPVSVKCLQRCGSSLIPNEFLCPITLEIMTDPVIVATGQTYERESIQKWLRSNHQTCPKTGQTLDHLSIAPNYALKNLIQQWCEKNNIELPRKEPVGSNGCLAELMDEITSLVQNLLSSDTDVQREVIMKIRILSKENPQNRILIANSGGITPLVHLLSRPDPRFQEHTVTALLNLSIDEENKRIIAREGAIPAIIEILGNGTDEAKENSAAALCSLSMLDENKVLVGALNGIPPLINLLKNGTTRGKKDAATALFNLLLLNQANKSRAIKADIITPLLNLLKDRSLGMIDEALSILLLLISHPHGRSEIGKLSFIETLVDITKNGTSKNKECAVSVLLELGLKNSTFILAALQYGAYDPLVELSRSGTNRAQRKASSLLLEMSKGEHIP